MIDPTIAAGASESPLLSRKSANYVYSPIAQHDSWLSVDPLVGCSMNCGYCYMQATGWTGVRPELVMSIPAIFEKLLAHPHFIPNETVLSFGNHTDPFLPQNVLRTREF